MSALAALVDVPAGDGQDNYLEWMSIDGKWERVGMSNATLVSLTTDEIDRIVAGEQVTSESVLDGTKLSYYMTKIKTAFAAFAHKHVTGDVTGLDTALGDKATKAELKTVQDSLSTIIKIGSIKTSISRQYASKATVAAPQVEGYDFVAWIACVTDKWIASVYASTPLNSSTSIWVATHGAYTDGQGDVICYALYVKSK